MDKAEPLSLYGDEAVQRAKDEAREWLNSADGFPRSWDQMRAADKRRGYVMYDEDEAPPISGYEALERDGYAFRIGPLVAHGEQRIHFRRAKKYRIIMLEPE